MKIEFTVQIFPRYYYRRIEDWNFWSRLWHFLTHRVDWPDYYGSLPSIHPRLWYHRICKYLEKYEKWRYPERFELATAAFPEKHIKKWHNHLSNLPGEIEAVEAGMYDSGAEIDEVIRQYESGEYY